MQVGNRAWVVWASKLMAKNTSAVTSRVLSSQHCADLPHLQSLLLGSGEGV